MPMKFQNVSYSTRNIFNCIRVYSFSSINNRVYSVSVCICTFKSMEMTTESDDFLPANWPPSSLQTQVPGASSFGWREFLIPRVRR